MNFGRWAKNECLSTKGTNLYKVLKDKDFI